MVRIFLPGCRVSLSPFVKKLRMISLASNWWATDSRKLYRKTDAPHCYAGEPCLVVWYGGLSGTQMWLKEDIHLKTGLPWLELGRRMNTTTPWKRHYFSLISFLGLWDAFFCTLRPLRGISSAPSSVLMASGTLICSLKHFSFSQPSSSLLVVIFTLALQPSSLLKFFSPPLLSSRRRCLLLPSYSLLPPANFLPDSQPPSFISFYLVLFSSTAFLPNSLTSFPFSSSLSFPLHCLSSFPFTSGSILSCICCVQLDFWIFMYEWLYRESTASCLLEYKNQFHIYSNPNRNTYSENKPLI